MDTEKKIVENTTRAYLKKTAEDMDKSGKYISAFYLYKMVGNKNKAYEVLEKEADVFKSFGFDKEALSLRDIIHNAINDRLFDDIKIAGVEKELIDGACRNIYNGFNSASELFGNSPASLELGKTLTHDMMLMENLYALEEKLSEDWPALYRNRPASMDYAGQSFISASFTYTEVYRLIKESVYAYDEFISKMVWEKIDHITDLVGNSGDLGLDKDKIRIALESLDSNTGMQAPFRTNFYDGPHYGTHHEYNYKAIEKMLSNKNSPLTKKEYLRKTLRNVEELLLYEEKEKASEMLKMLSSRALWRVNGIEDYASLYEKSMTQKSNSRQAKLDSYMGKLRK
jgi:hypothetical protein